MAKSLRSKRQKRPKAIRREIVKPLYDKMDEAMFVAQEAALAAPKLPVRAHNSTNSMDLVTLEASTSSTTSSIVGNTAYMERDVQLIINDDIDASDEDDEHSVFNFKDANDNGSDDNEDNEDDYMDDDTQLIGLAAKISRQQKYLRAQFGGIEEEMSSDIEDKEEKRTVWGRRKNTYYNADNNEYELQSSDEELFAEEAEVLRLQKENAKALSLEDFGIQDFSQDGSDGESTLEEVLVEGKATLKASTDREAHDVPDSVYEKVKKDLNVLLKEEQMDVVYSSAPELVGLLLELNAAFEELENKVNPLMSKVKEHGNTMIEGMHYMELKQVMLLAYCQSIIFYLLLKSEGQPVRDHPVIARIVDVKNLLGKLKQLDENFPFEIEDILSKKDHVMLKSLRGVDVGQSSDSLIYDIEHAVEKQNSVAVPHQQIQKLKMKGNEKREKKHKHLIISGDDALPPKLDNIGERRMKHELRVLAGAGIGCDGEVGDGLGSAEDDHDMEEGGCEFESEDEFYREVKQQRASTVAAKSNTYARTPTTIQCVPEEAALVDGKRHITYQMEKNRGLTRNRKKATKNPRKKYRFQHEKTVVRRKGQVPDMRKPSGPYCGEASGINAGISRSIRFRRG